MRLTLTPKVLLIISLMALAFSTELKVCAQTHEPKFNLIETADGITFGKINDMVRDRHGVIWFADQSNGLIRYDGTHITAYPHDMQNPNSLGGQNPEDMLIDSNGIFWISFWGTGLDRFDPETGEFKHYRHLKDDPASVSNDSISAILIDHVGNLWVGTNQGLDLLDPQTGKFKHYKHDPKDPTSLSFNLVRSLYEDREGTLWIGTGMAWETHQKGGLNKFNRDAENFTRYLHDPKDPQSLINNKVRSIFEDSRGNFWVGTAGDGLHSMDRNTGKFTRHLNNPKNPHQLSRPPVTGENGDHITFIMEDVEGQIWIGTWSNGINRYNPITNEITYFGKMKGGLDANRAWIARSFDDGLFWLSSDVPSAKLYQVDLFTNTIPFTPVSGSVGVNGFFQSEPEILWIASEGGGLIKKYLTNQHIEIFRHNPDNPKSVSSDNVRAILMDRNNHFWIGTDKGLNKFDPKTGTFTRYHSEKENKENVTDNSIIALYEDYESNIWIATWAGLDKFNINTGRFSHYEHTKDTSSLSGNTVIGVLENTPGELWVSVWYGGGVNRLNTKTGKFKHYLKGVNAGHFFKDGEGSIWVGTSNGLFKYSQSIDNFSLVNYNDTRGMNDEIRTNLCDQSDNIWLVTSKNIFSLNKERTISYRFGKENQINKIIWYLSSYNTLDGKLLFGTDGGYYSINPAELKSNPIVPKIDFTDFWISNESLNSNHDNSSKSLISAEEIELNYSQNIFSIGFSVTDYSHTTRKVFYKLDGYDLNWRQPGSEGRAYYFNVPPGKYTFTVKANNDSNTNWQERKITITISPPWWRTWWAYGSFGILFIGLVFSVDRFQRNRLLKRAEVEAKEKELAQAKEIEKAYHELKVTQTQLIQSEKMASLGELTAGIAHEIQNPLNFVNNFSEVNSELIAELKEEIAKGNLEEVNAIANHIDENEKKIIFHGMRADAIVKSMLQHSRSTSNKKEPTDINALADEYLRLAYHGLRAKNKSFNATIKTDLDESVDKINVVPQDIGRAILNLITNAFYVVTEKKGSTSPDYEPTVTVSTKRKTDTIEIIVSDNGNGIPKAIADKIFQPFFTTKPAGKGTGLGLSLSYDIITKGHEGQIKVESQEGVGTSFIIILPLK